MREKREEDGVRKKVKRLKEGRKKYVDVKWIKEGNETVLIRE